MKLKISALPALLVLLCAVVSARAEYADECRGVADKFARDPGALNVGEIDFLKNCLSSLQRGIVLGEAPPAPSPAPAVACPAAVVQECPVCAAAVTCPKREAAATPAPAKEKARDREPPEDRRLRPYLPKY